MGYWARRRAGQTHEEALNPSKKIRKSKNLISREDILEIRKLINEGILSLRAIGRKFKKDHSTISNIKYGKTYKHII